MDSLSNFTNELKNFGFDRQNDPQNKMTDYLFFTLNILINYDITYEYQYDTRNTKLSNFLYNLTLDGIKMPLFGDKTNNLAIQLLKKLNRDVDLYTPNEINIPKKSTKKQVNKNMRDLIIRRSDFFYNGSDTSTFGKFYDISRLSTSLPETLSSFPTQLYGKLFERSSLPRFMYEIDENYPTKLNPLFNGKPIVSPDGYGEQLRMKRILFYAFIVAQIPHPSIGNIPLPFNYCMIANLLTVNEYDQMLRTDGTVLVIRSVMSRLLNKILIEQAQFKQNTKPAIMQYNSYVDTINMISIFPHYSFYLIAKHIRENNPRENDPTKCGDPKYRGQDETISPYVVEFSKINTSNPTQYPYTENYKGFGMNDNDEDDNTPKESFAFYNATNPYISSSQYASW
jgi:hypothetical protein